MKDTLYDYIKAHPTMTEDLFIAADLVRRTRPILGSALDRYGRDLAGHALKAAADDDPFKEEADNG